MIFASYEIKASIGPREQETGNLIYLQVCILWATLTVTQHVHAQNKNQSIIIPRGANIAGFSLLLQGTVAAIDRQHYLLLERNMNVSFVK